MIVLNFEQLFLEFIIPARTSRGEYKDKKVTLISLTNGNKIGLGEASPLPDLSIDGEKDLAIPLEIIKEQLLQKTPIPIIVAEWNEYPSIQFALECAALGLQSKNGILFDTFFTRKEKSIPINGLVWMNDTESMYLHAVEKAKEGFGCIKFKIGALDHDDECRMIEKVRNQYSPFQLEIRLDANGAFDPNDAIAKLKDFSRFGIHSIEQPIKAGQWELMQEICIKSAIDIALDEELIGIDEAMQGEKLLKNIQSKYLILKPTLLGGFTRCNRWIALAKKFNMGWWATSALESNVGLGHIAQWVSTHNITMPQGLGTGSLYSTNLEAETALLKDEMWHVKKVHLQ